MFIFICLNLTYLLIALENQLVDVLDSIRLHLKN